jgi:hypothetical protein
MPIERRLNLTAAGMAKRRFRRVSGGQDPQSERPARWHGLAPALANQPTKLSQDPATRGSSA